MGQSSVRAMMISMYVCYTCEVYRRSFLPVLLKCLCTYGKYWMYFISPIWTYSYAILRKVVILLFFSIVRYLQKQTEEIYLSLGGLPYDTRATYHPPWALNLTVAIRPEWYVYNCPGQEDNVISMKTYLKMLAPCQTLAQPCVPIVLYEFKVRVREQGKYMNPPSPLPAPAYTPALKRIILPADPTSVQPHLWPNY